MRALDACYAAPNSLLNKIHNTKTLITSPRPIHRGFRPEGAWLSTSAMLLAIKESASCDVLPKSATIPLTAHQKSTSPRAKNPKDVNGKEDSMLGRYVSTARNNEAHPKINRPVVRSANLALTEWLAVIGPPNETVEEVENGATFETQRILVEILGPCFLSRPREARRLCPVFSSQSKLRP